MLTTVYIEYTHSSLAVKNTNFQLWLRKITPAHKKYFELKIKIKLNRFLYFINKPPMNTESHFTRSFFYFVKLTSSSVICPSFHERRVTY